jgi:hypothetical protein
MDGVLYLRRTHLRPVRGLGCHGPILRQLRGDGALRPSPLEYRRSRVGHLFNRGNDRYVVDSEDRPEDLLEDIERAGTAAFKHRVPRVAAARTLQ